MNIQRNKDLPKQKISVNKWNPLEKLTFDL